MAAKTKRPRVWVPGLAWVSEERELVVGAHAGFNGYGKAFKRSRCAHVGSIVELRHRLWLVERSALSDKLIDEHAIILADRLIDEEHQPHARRWLAEQPLVCVSGLKAAALVDAGLRLFTVAHGVDGAGILRLSAEGGKRAAWSLRGSVADMLPAEWRPSSATDLVRANRPEARTFVDRLLGHLSRGALREVSVMNAWAVSALIEPGYGYHGATDGVASTLEEVQRGVRALEALFAQVYDRAEAQREDAAEMRRALVGAALDAEEVKLPVYGSARREDTAEMAVVLGSDGSGAEYRIGDELQETLSLPADPRWIVSRVDGWSPELPADLAAEKDDREPGPTTTATVAIVLVAMLVILIAVGLALE